MSKKTLKILILILAIILLIQIPFFKNIYDNIKNDAIEKRDNVADEYDRVKDKVTDTKDKVIDTKDKVKDVVEKVGETADKIGDLVDGSKEKATEDDPEFIICTEEAKAAEMCTMDYNPVCGDDGVTYGNACAACASGNIDAYVIGECIAE